MSTGSLTHTDPFLQPLASTGLAEPSELDHPLTASAVLGVAASAPLRVLHIVNGEHFAGAERVQSHLGRCLPRFGIRADFVCVKPGRFADAVDGADGAWGIAYREPMRGRIDLGIARRVAERAQRGGYDLLHAHTPRTALVTAMAARRCGLPWVYHVHSPASRDCSRRLVNWANARVQHWALTRCDALITVSQSLRRDCIALGYDPSQVSVVHNGVPAICYDRPSLPSPGGPWTVGMIALMRPRKGLEVALEALAALRGEGVDLVLRCIGPFETDSYQRSIWRQIERLGIGDQVEQIGFESDIPLALSRVDALLLPSLYGEGLPMVVLEAMAAGLPVIATSVEGTPEAISDGVEGLLAKPGCVRSLAAQLQRLASGQVSWQSLSQAARQRHAAEFSDWAMARGVADVYRRVLTESRLAFS